MQAIQIVIAEILQETGMVLIDLFFVKGQHYNLVKIGEQGCHLIGNLVVILPPPPRHLRHVPFIKAVVSYCLP